MAAILTWPNLVTAVRLILFFLVVMFAYGTSMWTRLFAAIIIILVIIGDWLDGHLARKMKQSTPLGSVFDIAADRIIETVLWIVLADLNLIPVWIPIVVITRGILTDSLRNYTLRFGYSGFGKKTMMQTPIGRFITGSPFMRTSYGLLKAFTFGWLLLFAVLDEIIAQWPLFPPEWIVTGLTIGYWAAVLSAIMCIVRGIPVIIEGVILIQQKENEN